MSSLVTSNLRTRACHAAACSACFAASSAGWQATGTMRMHVWHTSPVSRRFQPRSDRSAIAADTPPASAVSRAPHTPHVTVSLTDFIVADYSVMCANRQCRRKRQCFRQNDRSHNCGFALLTTRGCKTANALGCPTIGRPRRGCQRMGRRVLGPPARSCAVGCATTSARTPARRPRSPTPPTSARPRQPASRASSRQPPTDAAGRT